MNPIAIQLAKEYNEPIKIEFGQLVRVGVTCEGTVTQVFHINDPFHKGIANPSLCLTIPKEGPYDGESVFLQLARDDLDPVNLTLFAPALHSDKKRIQEARNLKNLGRIGILALTADGGRENWYHMWLTAVCSVDVTVVDVSFTDRQQEDKLKSVTIEFVANPQKH